MATNTSNLNLVLPEYGDSADVSVLNSNFQKIDNAFGSGGNQDLNTTSDVTFKSVTAEVVYGAVFME